MPVEIAGFAQALARCQSFDSIDTAELERALAFGKRPLEMHFVAPSADVAFIQSGQPFSHLYFVQHGMMVPWQYPHSELSSPFLIGEHEFVMGAHRWVAPYSAAEETTVIGIPKETMQLICDRVPLVREQMNRILMRRISRYYWTSLATSGNPASRVAAALISRLALEQDDFGTKKEISILQRDLVRLTVMSRSAVAAGVAVLAADRVIRIGSRPSERFRGIVQIPDVDRLKQAALADVREREVRPLLQQLAG